MTFFSKQSELNSPTICGTKVTLVVQEAGFTVVFFKSKISQKPFEGDTLWSRLILCYPKDNFYVLEIEEEKRRFFSSVGEIIAKQNPVKSPFENLSL